MHNGQRGGRMLYAEQHVIAVNPPPDRYRWQTVQGVAVRSFARKFGDKGLAIVYGDPRGKPLQTNGDIEFHVNFGRQRVPSLLRVGESEYQLSLTR